MMKLYTIIIVTLFKTVTLQSQNDLGGVYQLKQKNIDSNNIRIVTLNCDSTFKIEILGFKFKAVGRWRKKPKDKITLKVDTIYNREHIIKEKREWDFYLQNGNLIEFKKTPTKKQYNRSNRKIDKIYKKGGHSGSYENYDSYKERNGNQLYIKKETFNCI